MPAKWTRNLTSRMGFEIEDFVKGFKAALSDPTIIQLVKETFTEPLQKEIVQLKRAMDKKDQQIHDMEKQIDSLEQYTRRNSLRVQGIPEKETEDTCEEVLKIVNETLGVNPPIAPSDIDRVHRVGPHSTNRSGPRPVIIKMATYRARARIFKERAKLRHCPDRIFINEDLTKLRSNLFRKARQHRKDGKLSDCWTYDGNILVKTSNGKIVRVTDEEQLQDIIS